MSADAVTPIKQDIPKEIWNVANTLSDDAQSAALKKCKEVPYDTSKDRISLEETLINLSHARDILLDAVEKRKLIQLPLKLQYLLLEQSQKVAKFLGSLANGTDEVVNLEDAVDDLNASVWQFNLHNLSGQILGFQNKMNQLKSQEVVLKSASREAERFYELKKQADQRLEEITTSARQIEQQRDQFSAAAEETKAMLNKCVEQEQRISGLSVQAQQMGESAAQHLARANVSAAETDAIATKSKELQAEIEGTRSKLADLTRETQQLIAGTGETLKTQLESFARKYDSLSSDKKTEMEAFVSQTTASIAQITAELNKKVDASAGAFQELSANTETRLGQMMSDAASRMSKAETDQQDRLAAHLKDASRHAEELTTQSKDEVDKAIKALLSDGQRVITENDGELKKLASELETLEGHIRASIERATGYTLFHSFQKRQEDLEDSKRLWGFALLAAVVTSLVMSGIFIYSLRFVQVYNAAFYLKLSISLPLIYAIAFCSVQYSRERRLEEEYAFKSSISISLEPYQKLVGNLVDKEKPEELAKYTAFVIDSVNRVFTSPTERIFDDKPSDGSSPEKIIKSLGEFLDPVMKALKK